ncbi:hypothetical protein SADUNF_Sadunf16G0175200 [Salix dunnii]|uniref:Uncharacterized protein n=1 Tax=Salix dunnii TaxID=1413687 RepID=A0A835J9C4_9ROSI|nr:hypothetical protein SADUNF_Sadunf16G0175200 [Salix dunnii]
MTLKDKVSAGLGMSEDNMVIGDEDFTIHNIKDCLYRPWKFAIIIKLMGKLLTYNFLHEWLLQLWKLNGPMTLVDFENNFFIVVQALSLRLDYGGLSCFLLYKTVTTSTIAGSWQGHNINQQNHLNKRDQVAWFNERTKRFMVGGEALILCLIVSCSGSFHRSDS